MVSGVPGAEELGLEQGAEAGGEEESHIIILEVEGRRVFFFVNKKEAKKTFGIWASGRFNTARSGAEVFLAATRGGLLFFQKKNCLLTSRP